MKLKYCVAVCSLLMLSFSPLHSFASSAASDSSKIQWEVERDWKLSAKPLDIVHSLDGKRVFILTENQKVMVYTAKGNLLGEIPVNSGVTAIDIAPRGEKLYLIDQDAKTFTDLSISFFADIDITGSPFVGKVDAPVTIAVFTDFE